MYKKLQQVINIKIESQIMKTKHNIGPNWFDDNFCLANDLATKSWKKFAKYLAVQIWVVNQSSSYIVTDVKNTKQRTSRT